VVYFLCYDLSQSTEMQLDQVAYWLDYLNSALSLPPSSSKYHHNAKWVIMLVGLKKDLQNRLHKLQLPHLEVWQNQFTRLPILPRLFSVSSTKSESSVQELLTELQEQCKRIFSKHTMLIPSSYRKILQDLQNLPANSAIHKVELFESFAHGLTMEGFSVALQYLHTIGRIVLLKSGLVYPDSTIASKIAAKFVSPKEVQSSLLEPEGVEILSQAQVGFLLKVENCSKR